MLSRHILIIILLSACEFCFLSLNSRVFDCKAFVELGDCIKCRNCSVTSAFGFWLIEHALKGQVSILVDLDDGGIT